MIHKKVYTNDISTINSGKSYTIKTNFEKGNGYKYYIHFKPGQNYSVFIHDPNFYVLSSNSEVFPHIFLNMDDKQTQSVFLKTTYHTMMNRPDQPCDSSESYSFTACIKNSISTKIGCRMEWDSWRSRDIPLCTTVEQLVSFDMEYSNHWNLQRQSLIENTGCLIPCSYTEYKLATEPMKFDHGTQKLNIRFSSPDVLKRTEQLLYPLESFVSEFGGELGLFLGFSCIMIWDALDTLLHYCLRKFSCVHYAIWKRKITFDFITSFITQ